MYTSEFLQIHVLTKAGIHDEHDPRALIQYGDDEGIHFSCGSIL